MCFRNVYSQLSACNAAHSNFPAWQGFADGEPSEADWTRLEKYATLVREVQFCYVGSDERKVWELIFNRYHTAASFLPRLTALETLRVTPTDALFDLPLLLPTLRHLCIKLDTSGPLTPTDGGSLMTTALERVATEIPSLLSLRISTAPQEANILWKMAPFRALHRLDITEDFIVHANILAAIGQFHDLRVLSIGISNDCTYLQGCLQALVELHIGGSASHIKSFLTATSPPLLRRLSLRFSRDPITDLLMQCLSSISTSVPLTLSALTLDSALAFTPPLTSVLDLVQPALAFRALSEFTFTFRPLPSISDADILTMLAAWPTLTTLRIEHDHIFIHPSPGPVRPTALLFPSIATGYPHLDTLELPEVDLTATPALDALPWPSPRGHDLRALDMARELDFRGIGNVSGNRTDKHACMRAAVMLDRLFPRMELPCMLRGGTRDDGEEKGWAAVVRLLHAMHAGRAHGDAFERLECGKDGDGDGTDESGDGDDDDEEEDEDEDMGVE